MNVVSLATLALLWSGCSLLEKEFETGRNVESNLRDEGQDDDATGSDGSDGRPGGDGTDPGSTDDGSGSSDDGDAGGDSSGDSGGETGSSNDDGGSGETERVDCTPGAVPVMGNLDTCISDVLTCGSSVITTTEGGNSVMDADDYLAWFCVVPDGDYIGSERTYNITVPAGQKATFTLESPCDDLDIFALRWELWESSELCPDYGNSVIECEADDSREGGEVEVFADPAQDTNYLVIIDGPDAEQAAFALDIACE